MAKNAASNLQGIDRDLDENVGNAMGMALVMQHAIGGAIQTLKGVRGATIKGKDLLYRQLVKQPLESVKAATNDMVKSGVILPEDGEVFIKDFEDFTKKDSRIPENVKNDEVRLKIAEIIAKKDAEEARLKTEDKAFHPEIKEKIKKYEEQIQELSNSPEAKKPIEEKGGSTDNSVLEELNSVNPTGSVFADYTPSQRMNAPLGDNMVSLDKTIGGSPDDIITIYRGGEGDSIVGGDYVTTNKQLAQDYAGKGKVIEMKVRKGDVIDDKTEPGGEEYIYRPEKKEVNYLVKRTGDFAKDKTANTETASTLLKDLGVDASFSGYSDANGVSVYFEDANGVKYRISDHSVTSKDRMANEVLLSFDQKTMGVGGKTGVKSNLESNKAEIQSKIGDEIRPALKDAEKVATPDNIQPVGRGFFGNIYDQFKGKAKEAIEFLMQKKEGEAVGALYHEDVGDIDLVWGNDSAGLQKIAEKHPEVLNDLQERLNKTEVVSKTNNRIKLGSDTDMFVVSQHYFGDEKRWLITAYEKKKGRKTATGSSMDIEPEPNGMQNGTAPLQNGNAPDANVQNTGGTSNSGEDSGEKPQRQDNLSSSKDTLVGETVDIVFAGGKTTGKVISEEGDRITVQDSKGIKYPVHKKDILQEGETPFDHIEKQKKLKKKTADDFPDDPGALPRKGKNEEGSREKPQQPSQPRQGIQSEPVKGTSDEHSFKIKTLLNTALEESTKKPISVQDIAKFINKVFGVPIRKGMIRGKNTLGIYKVTPEVIRVKNTNDIGTLSHEFAHHLDKKNFQKDFPFSEELKASITTKRKDGHLRGSLSLFVCG